MHILCLQVVALKLLYGLDGRQPQVLPPGVAAPPDWQAWAAAAYERIADPCNFPLSPEQVGIGPFCFASPLAAELFLLAALAYVWQLWVGRAS